MCMMSRKNYRQDIHQSISYTVERQVPFACPAMNQKAEALSTAYTMTVDNDIVQQENNNANRPFS